MVAGGLSGAIAFFLFSWQLRARVRACESTVDELHERITLRDQRHAAQASVAKRKAASKDDELVAEAIRQQAGSPHYGPHREPAAWWDGLVGKKELGYGPESGRGS